MEEPLPLLPGAATEKAINEVAGIVEIPEEEEEAAGTAAAETVAAETAAAFAKMW